MRGGGVAWGARMIMSPRRGNRTHSDSTPSSRYSGERAGERGERRSASDRVRLDRRRNAANRTMFDSMRTSPLSPTLSPAYREEGVDAHAHQTRPSRPLGPLVVGV